MQEKWCERFELRFGIFLSTGHAKLEECTLERQFFRNSRTEFTPNNFVAVFNAMTATIESITSPAGISFWP
jgi:hypothetical protein